MPPQGLGGSARICPDYPDGPAENRVDIQVPDKFAAPWITNYDSRRLAWFYLSERSLAYSSPGQAAGGSPFWQWQSGSEIQPSMASQTIFWVYVSVGRSAGCSTDQGEALEAKVEP